MTKVICQIREFKYQAGCHFTTLSGEGGPAIFSLKNYPLFHVIDFFFGGGGSGGSMEETSYPLALPLDPPMTSLITYSTVHERRERLVQIEPVAPPHFLFQTYTHNLASLQH